MRKEWSYKEQAPETFRKLVPEYSPFVQDLLWQRGLHTRDAIERFFHPDYHTGIHDPHMLKGMKKAADRIRRAIVQQEYIVLYGDYDSDGVSGLTILAETLEKLGCSAFSVYIPDRAKEGHGLQMGAVEQFVKDGAGLIVTVDCGITNIDEIVYAQKHGVDVVVTDHHQVIAKNPAYAVVDPHQKGERYPFAHLCGAAVAFKVAQVLLEGHAKEGWDRWFLDLVALACITDVMPLIDENRIFVTYGLYVMAHGRRPGLRELMRVSRIEPRVSRRGIGTNLTPRMLGFALGPRINAAGRIDHANTAFALLRTQDKKEARGYAEQLEKTNKKRQAIIERIMKDLARCEKEFMEVPAIIVGSANWPIGVLGIVAGKLADRYHKPAFVYEIQGKEFRGSARSIYGFSIVESLTDAGEHLSAYGGHPMAGGFSGTIAHEQAFRDALLSYADTIFDGGAAPPVLEIDLRLRADQITQKFFHDLARFEPFGEANPVPIFALEDMQIVSIRQIGNGKKHLLFQLRDENGTLWKALFFGSADSHSHLEKGGRIAIACELEQEEWNGRRSLIFKIIDIKE